MPRQRNLRGGGPDSPPAPCALIKRLRSRDERAFALLLVMLLLVAFTGLGIMLSTVSFTESNLQANEMRWQLALQSAEAGVHEALHRLYLGRVNGSSDPDAIYDTFWTDNGPDYTDVADASKVWRINQTSCGAPDTCFTSFGGGSSMDYEVTVSYVRPRENGAAGSTLFEDLFPYLDEDDDGILDNQFVNQIISAGGTDDWVLLAEFGRLGLHPDYAGTDRDVNNYAVNTITDVSHASPVYQITSTGKVPPEHGGSPVRRTIVARVYNAFDLYGSHAICSCNKLEMGPTIAVSSYPAGGDGNLGSNGDMELSSSSVINGAVDAYGASGSGICDDPQGLCFSGGGTSTQVLGPAESREGIQNYSDTGIFQGGATPNSTDMHKPCACESWQIKDPPTGIDDPLVNDNDLICDINAYTWAVPPGLAACPAGAAGDVGNPPSGGVNPTINVSGNAFNKIINIQPGSYYFTDFATDNSAVINITASTSDPVKIYIDGCFQTGSNTQFNYYESGGSGFWDGSSTPTTGDEWLSKSFSIFVIGNQNSNPACSGNPPVYIHSNNAYYLDLYSPESNAELASNEDIFGRIMGNDVEVNSNLNVLFDEVYAADKQYFPGNYFRIADWREI
ncbi:MAG: hypothetical protein HYV63_15760 [Candidatus Schekmanbacteria bacterium]|nr:hypothetical protein [Candidatus Schekmanbacteria bacterium]